MKKLVIIIGVSMLIFLPSLGNFFGSDDWFHLRVAKIGDVGELVNFFRFDKTEQRVSFYRPLSTQVFFWAGRNLFGLNPVPYHLIVMGSFEVLLVMIYKLLRELKVAEDKVLAVVLISGISVTNFTRLYFLSAFQELAMGVAVLGGLASYVRGSKYYWLWLVIGLMSKETAVVFGGLMLLVDWYRKKFEWRKYVVVGLITGLYLGLRLGVFRGAEGDSYIWDFSIKRAINTMGWYGLWSLGVPELMVDYVGSGLRILPRFYSDLGVWAKIILGASSATMGMVAVNWVGSGRKIDRINWLGMGWFLVGIIPVIFLPWHKYSLELTLSMVGTGLLMANNLCKNRIGAGLFWISFLGLNLAMNYWNWENHYAIQRGRIAERFYRYLAVNYPQYPEGKSFRVVNDKGVEVALWGQSKQVAWAAGVSEMAEVVYGKKGIKIYYDDLDKEIVGETINLKASWFLEE